MKKRLIFGILLMLLLINISLAEEAEEAEDIALYIDQYSPRIINIYDLATPNAVGQGNYYTVYATLKGILTNPTITIPKIDSISVSAQGSEYALVRHVAPVKQTYTLDNMGYLLINLKKNAFKTEENVPDAIELNIKATVKYKQNYGFGIFQDQIKLQEIDEKKFLDTKDNYNFWNNRGYLRLEKYENGVATISLYDSKLTKIRTFKLNSQSTSEQFTLTKNYLLEDTNINVGNKARIKFERVVSGERSARLQLVINNEVRFVELYEGEYLYDSSSWKVSSIFTDSQGNNQVVLENKDTNEKITLRKNQKSTINCKVYDKEQCDLYVDRCKYVNNECFNIDEVVSSTTISTSNNKLLESMKSDFRSYNFQTRQQAIASRINSLTPSNIGAIASDLDKLTEDYFTFINKYPTTTNPYYDLCRRLLSVPSSQYTSVIEMYDSLVKTSTSSSKSTYESKLNDLKNKIIGLGVTVNTETDTTTLKLSSQQYYEEAIINYQQIVDNYQDSKDTNAKLIAPQAQKQIADIYTYNLYNIPKAIEALKVLLYKFDETEFVKSQKEDIEKTILILEDRNNYDINSEKITNDNDIIDISLYSISNKGESSKVTLDINGIQKQYNLGDSLGPSTDVILRSWVIDEINSDNIIIVKRTDTGSQKLTLKYNNQIAVDGIPIKLIRVDSQTNIIVSVLPGVENAYSVTNFKVRLPIEKRLFELTPEAIEKEIAATEKVINSLDAVTSRVSQFNTLYRGYCYGTFATLYTKNLFSNKQYVKARSEVVSKWKNYCSNIYPIREKPSSYDKCINEHSSIIESQVDKAQEIIERVEKDNNIPDYLKEATIKKEIATYVIQSDISSSPEDKDYPNLGVDLKKSFSEDYIVENQNAQTNGKLNNEITKIHNIFYDSKGDLKTDVSYDKYQVDYPKEYAVLTDSTKSEFEKKEATNSILSKETNRLRLQYKTDFGGASVYASDNLFNSYADSYYTELNKQSSSLITNDIRQANTNSITYIIKDNKKEYYYTFNGIDYPLYFDKDAINLLNSGLDVNLNQIGKEYYIKLSNGNVEKITILEGTKKSNFIPSLVLSEASGSKGRIESIMVDPYHYVKVIDRDSRNVITKIEIWETNTINKIADGHKLDVIENYNYATCKKEIESLYASKETKTDSFILLKQNNQDACDILKKAEEASQKAILTTDKEKTLPVVGVGEYQIAKFAAETSDLDCIDVYSVNECRLLSGACDPVLCPASRFNMNGRYQVSNVIQTGIGGGIVLGLNNFDPPYEPLPVCLTGINAGLKNIQSIFEGYQQCLEDKKTTGQAIGGCSYIRRIGFCEVVWGTTTSVTNAFGGVEKIIESGVNLASTSSSGGSEYVTNFQENFKRSNAFAGYFTSTYRDNVLAAYKGKATSEIGTEICKAAIYGKLPGQGSFVDQFLKPSVPAQFLATYDEVPQTSVDGQSLSIYRVFYNIYAGEDSEIKYRVLLQRSSDGATKAVTYTKYLERGKTEQETVNVQNVPNDFDQICVQINNEPLKCGFGKVSTEFAIQYYQDKALESEVNKKITSTKDCETSTSNYLTNPSVYTTPLSIIGGSGVAETGIVRRCQVLNPGLGTTKQDNWIEVGNCDSSDGICWLDKSSVNYADTEKQKEIDELDSALSNYISNLIPKEEVIAELNNLNILKVSQDNKLEQTLNIIRTTKKSEEVLAQESNLNSIEDKYLEIIQEYKELAVKTNDETMSGRIYYEIGSSYKSLGSLKSKSEKLKYIAESKTAKPITTTTAPVLTDKCKLSESIEGGLFYAGKYLCKDVKVGDILRLLGSDVKINVLQKYSAYVGINEESNINNLYYPFEFEVYKSKSGIDTRVGCGALSFIGIQRNIVLDKLNVAKKCDDLIIIKGLSVIRDETSTTDKGREISIDLEIEFTESELKDLIEASTTKKILTKSTTEVAVGEISEYSKSKIQYYSNLINQVYNSYPLPKDGNYYLAAILTQESLEYANLVRTTTSYTDFEAEEAVSYTGPAGIAQFTQATAQQNGLIISVDYNGKCVQQSNKIEEMKDCLGKNPEKDERFDGTKSIIAAGKYLSYLAAHKNVQNNEVLMIAAYNAGPGAVVTSSDCPGKRIYECPGENVPGSNYVPYRNGETITYINKVLGYKKYYLEHPELLSSTPLASNEEPTEDLTTLQIDGPLDQEQLS